MKNITVLSTFVILLLLQGCTTVQYSPNNEQTQNLQTNDDPRRVKLGKNVKQPIELIAEDMVNALSQIPQLTTNGESIGVLTNRSGFDTAISNQLKSRGFTTINVNQETGDNRIITSTVPSQAGGNEVTLVLTINQYALRRTYEINRNFVRPMSSLYVRGYSASRIRLDDRIFVAGYTGGQ